MQLKIQLNLIFFHLFIKIERINILVINNLFSFMNALLF